MNEHFDFFDEYNNKNHIIGRYEFNYRFGKRKYSNALFIFDVKMNNSNSGNYIL